MIASVLAVQYARPVFCELAGNAATPTEAVGHAGSAAWSSEDCGRCHTAGCGAAYVAPTVESFPVVIAALPRLVRLVAPEEAGPGGYPLSPTPPPKVLSS